MKATCIGLFEAKTNFGQIVKRSVNGENIVITDRGKPVIRLVPMVKSADANELRTAYEKFKVIRKGVILNPKGETKLSINQLKREGQKG